MKEKTSSCIILCIYFDIFTYLGSSCFNFTNNILIYSYCSVTIISGTSCDLDTITMADFSFNDDDYSDECLSPPVVSKKYIGELTVTSELQLVNAEREELTATSIQQNTPRSVVDQWSISGHLHKG